MQNDKDFLLFVGVFPPYITQQIEKFYPDLIEVVLDIGRPLELRTDSEVMRVEEVIVSSTDIQYVVNQISNFTISDRAGIPETLHRFSRIESMDKKIVGLTCRIGKPYAGSSELVRSYIKSPGSVLIIGRPGLGKTSSLRNAARLLSTDYEQRVVIIDKDQEICGTGITPHESVGYSRRMVVPVGKSQAQIMIAAVENHYPSVVICDELSSKEEAEAVLTVCKRGVDVIATAHGNTLEDVLRNPALSKTLGNIRSVTLGDEEAERRGTTKTILEREIDPAFTTVVELQEFNKIGVYENVKESVDAILSGGVCVPQILVLDGDTVKLKEIGRVSMPMHPTAPPVKRRNSK